MSYGMDFGGLITSNKEIPREITAEREEYPMAFAAYGIWVNGDECSSSHDAEDGVRNAVGMLKDREFIMNGDILWTGDQLDDIGIIRVTDNEVFVIHPLEPDTYPTKDLVRALCSAINTRKASKVDQIKAVRAIMNSGFSIWIDELKIYSYLVDDDDYEDAVFSDLGDHDLEVVIRVISEMLYDTQTEYTLDELMVVLTRQESEVRKQLKAKKFSYNSFSHMLFEAYIENM